MFGLLDFLKNKNIPITTKILVVVFAIVMIYAVVVVFIDISR